MKLFGLVESMTLESLLGSSSPIPIHNEELFDIIRGFPRDLSIGLQLESFREQFRIDDVTFQNQQIFLDLYRHFRRNGNQIIFLETEDYFRKVAETGLEINNLRDFMADEDGLSNQTLYDLYSKMDKLKIEMDYMMMVGIENVILENIAKQQPRAIFIGQAHADEFYRRYEELNERYGIVINEYWRHEIESEPELDLGEALKMDDFGIPIESLLSRSVKSRIRLVHPSERFDEDPRVFTTKRLYKSIKEGHITDGNPDFRGNWFVSGFNIGKPYRGLFEVYLHSPFIQPETTDVREISGRIEDCFGSAQFNGTISNSGISFLKRYEDPRYGGSPLPIQYNGVFNNGRYEGQFFANDKMGKKATFGTFIMEPIK